MNHEESLSLWKRAGDVAAQGGELRAARELADRILRLGAATADRGVLLEGHLALGIALYYLAELPAARRELESALGHYRPEAHRGHAQRFGEEPGMAGHIYLAKCCWVLGDSDGAEAHSRAAARIADESEHPHTLARSLAFRALVRHLRGDVEGTTRLADRAVAVSDEHDFPAWKACGQVLQGWATCERGQPDEGIERMHEGIAAWRGSGTTLYTPYWLGLLGCAEGSRGNAEAALRLVRQAISLQTRGEERVTFAELHRMHGEILRQARASDAQARAEAEDAIVAACAIARRQGANGWERRAALSLAASVQAVGRLRGGP